MQAILSLAHSLGLEVVAEGVEREQQAECLARMQCDVMQGFFFAPPQRGRGDSGADPAGACARGVESGAGGGAGVIRFGWTWSLCRPAPTAPRPS